MVTTAQPEEVVTGVEPALEAAEATTGTVVAPVAGIVPTGSSVNADAAVANPVASQEPVMPGVGEPVVMQQTIQASDVVDGGNQKRRAARRLV